MMREQISKVIFDVSEEVAASTNNLDKMTNVMEAATYIMPTAADRSILLRLPLDISHNHFMQSLLVITCYFASV